ncbi:MAG TPA: hypothetical protein VGL23_16265 [Chloroflexota bacterium]|jgi:hypothetical protein
MSRTLPSDPPAAIGPDLELMRRVALTRLRRFERVAAVAAESGSPLWRRLATHAAAAALRDCLLLGLDSGDDEDDLTQLACG